MRRNVSRTRAAGLGLSMGCLAIALVATLLTWVPTVQADDINVADSEGRLRQPSLVLDAAGNPVITYWDTDTTTLKVLHCDDPNCAGTETPTTPVANQIAAEYTSLALDSAGNPVIAYVDVRFEALKLLHCDDPNCAGTETPTTPAAASGAVPAYPALALDAAGNPVIAYAAADDSVKLLHCDDPNCAGTETPTTPVVASGASTNRYISMALGSTGNPIIAYRDASAGLQVLACDDPNCTGAESPSSPLAAGEHGYLISMVLDFFGNPVISYLDFDSSEMKILHCADPACSTPVTPSTPDPGAAGTMSIALTTAGFPVIAYIDSGLNVMRCDDRDCIGTERSTVVDPASSSSPSMAIDTEGNPVVAYIDLGTDDLKVVHCDDAACFPSGTCNGLAPTIVATPGVPTNGTGGDDVILGTAGDDVIEGKGGNDTICGLDGDDYLQGGQGDDYVDGGPGADKLFGAQGDDVMLGGDDDDILHGNGGNDDLSGDGGDDRIFGYADDDRILGGDGNDRLHGNFGDDRMFGGEGDDRMFGYGDNDFLVLGPGNDLGGGNFGDDELNGGAGDDTIYGSDGADTVNGGAGNDTLEGNSGPDVLNGGDGNDAMDGGIFPDTCNGGAGTDTATRCETINGVP